MCPAVTVMAVHTSSIILHDITLALYLSYTFVYIGFRSIPPDSCAQRRSCSTQVFDCPSFTVCSSWKVFAPSSPSSPSNNGITSTLSAKSLSCSWCTMITATSCGHTYIDFICCDMVSFLWKHIKHILRICQSCIFRWYTPPCWIKLALDRCVQ